MATTTVSNGRTLNVGVGTLVELICNSEHSWTDSTLNETSFYVGRIIHAEPEAAIIRAITRYDGEPLTAKESEQPVVAIAWSDVRVHAEQSEDAICSNLTDAPAQPDVLTQIRDLLDGDVEAWFYDAEGCGYRNAVASVEPRHIVRDVSDEYENVFAWDHTFVAVEDVAQWLERRGDLVPMGPTPTMTTSDADPAYRLAVELMIVLQRHIDAIDGDVAAKHAHITGFDFSDVMEKAVSEAVCTLTQASVDQMRLWHELRLGLVC